MPKSRAISGAVKGSTARLGARAAVTASLVLTACADRPMTRPALVPPPVAVSTASTAEPGSTTQPLDNARRVPVDRPAEVRVGPGPTTTATATDDFTTATGTVDSATKTATAAAHPAPVAPTPCASPVGGDDRLKCRTAEGQWQIRNVEVDEDELVVLQVGFVAAADEPRRVFAVDLPPGAEYKDGRFEWRPDFLQGGRAWRATFLTDTGTTTSSTVSVIRVADTIRPPTPKVVKRIVHDEDVHLLVEQTTDAFLDSPGNAGRRLYAQVVHPLAPPPEGGYPVQVRLHGFNGTPDASKADGQIRIHPHDPQNTYWWGYASSLPQRRPSRSVPNYSQRRALHLLDWVLKTQPHADPHQAYVDGESMGGSGALALGLLYARHFAVIESTVGQTIARNHRPRRIAQLSRLWGSPAVNLQDGDRTAPLGVWDRLDMVRALAATDEARNQFVFTHHAKDDPVIHFGAVVHKSPKMKLSFYEALQALRIGHFVVWDEGGHGVPDPVLFDEWWSAGWNRLTDPETYFRNNLAFVAFTRSSADDDPGDGTGNGTQRWHVDRGFAGKIPTPGDTGWTGDRAGARNRYLRWNSTAIVDRWDRFDIPLRADLGPEGADPLGTPVLPIRVDVTPRRVQAFRCDPGERIHWQFGARQGWAAADRYGAVTVPQLALTDEYQTLTLTRGPPETSL